MPNWLKIKQNKVTQLLNILTEFNLFHWQIFYFLHQSNPFSQCAAKYNYV